jgi:hypothetical protein
VPVPAVPANIVPKGFYEEGLFSSDGVPFKSPAPGSLRLVQTGTGFTGTPMTVYTDANGSNPDPTGAAHTDAYGNLRAYLDPDVGHFDIYTSTGLLFTSDLGVPVSYNPNVPTAAQIATLKQQSITSVLSIAATTTAVAGTEYLCTAGASGFALTLPPVAGLAAGAIVTGKKVDAAAGVVTVTPPAGVTIDGAATFPIGTQFQSVDFVFDGTNFEIH